ncbi:MAG: hypothetical protein V1920_06945 [Bacillota bacterium]
MSNLKEAAKALRQKQPKRTFDVVFEETETYTWRGEAIDEQDARDQASEEYDNGGVSSDGNSSNHIISTEEVPT